MVFFALFSLPKKLALHFSYYHLCYQYSLVL